MRSAPPHQLDPRALRLWQLSGVIFTASVLAVVILVGVLLLRATSAAPAWVIGIGLAAVVATASSIWPIPAIEYRHWRYGITDEEVDFQRGWFTVTRTLVPIAQIQHVDTRQGPLERRFGLATVLLHTAAGTNEIPALDLAVASDLRDRIATLANVNQGL